jgi:mRNA interferase HigB
VVIIAKAKLTAFGGKYADSVDPLNNCWRKAKKSDWATVADVRKTFNSVDYVGNDRFVFNIKGNKYRLVVMIFFDVRTMYVRFVGTHTNYDRIDCERI